MRTTASVSVICRMSGFMLSNPQIFPLCSLKTKVMLIIKVMCVQCRSLRSSRSRRSNKRAKKAGEQRSTPRVSFRSLRVKRLLHRQAISLHFVLNFTSRLWLKHLDDSSFYDAPTVRIWLSMTGKKLCTKHVSLVYTFRKKAEAVLAYKGSKQETKM